MSSIGPKRPRIKVGRDSYGTLHRKVLERDGWRCQRCGRANQLEVHHIRFRSALGDDELDNLITLCSECHRAIHQGSTKTGTKILTRSEVPLHRFFDEGKSVLSSREAFAMKVVIRPAFLTAVDENLGIQNLWDAIEVYAGIFAETRADQVKRPRAASASQ